MYCHTARQVHLQRRLQLQTIFESLEKFAQTSNKRGTNLECRIFVHIAYSGDRDQGFRRIVIADSERS